MAVTQAVSVFKLTVKVLDPDDSPLDVVDLEDMLRECRDLQDFHEVTIDLISQED